MKNRRVFIGWNGEDNRDVALKVSNALSTRDFSPIVGGKRRASLTVSEEIIRQMNGCDYAIMLIEKEIRKNKSGQVISMGMNPNVMMELGYMLHKVTDHNNIRRILIDMEPGELPSDLQGSWSVVVDKDAYSTPDEREKALSEIAEKVVDDFLKYMETAQNSNIIDYFDSWNENSFEIYHFTGDVRIADKLIYGMQAAIYSDEFDRLYDQLGSIKKDLSEKDSFNDYPAVACAMAILNVFVVSRRLTVVPTEEQFEMLCEALEYTYESEIDDDDLRAWCEIFRKDKLELLYEMYASKESDADYKKDLYYTALGLCDEVVSLIDKQTAKSQQSKHRSDEKYALIYRAFVNRNISQVHKQLSLLEPENAEEHTRLHMEYCAKTLEIRSELYKYYKGSRRENTISMDFVSQEYLLALAEQYKFEENPRKKAEILRTAKTIYYKWRDKNAVRNMIFEKVKAESAGFLPDN